MTNSHNRKLGAGGHSESNTSRPRIWNGSTEGQHNGKSRRYKGKKPRNLTVSPTNSISSNQSDSNNYFNDRSYHSNHQAVHPRNSYHNQQYNFTNYNSNVPLHRSSPGGLSAASSTASSSPPTSTLFAGSKCYDAPKANLLPRPPKHWLVQSRTSDDDLSHNLKLMLNVKPKIVADWY